MLAHVENRITYSGNGNATEFAYQFKILNRTDIKVLLTDADGKEKLLTKDYYVDVEKSVVRYPGYAVGAEVPESERPAVLPAGWKLTIYREVPVTQETDLPDQYPFNQVEDIGDKLTMIAQQLTDTTGRSLKIGVSKSTDIDTVIPWENGKSFRISDDGKTLELSEDPAKVLPLAQGVYAQTQAQAQIASASAAAAAKSEDSAFESAGVAGNSAQYASLSAASAAENAELTSGYKQEALTAKADATASATNAKASEANAKTSENNAEASKEAAQSAATTASNYASASRGSANEAQTFKTTTQTYMNNAELYMNNAKNYSENVNVFIPSVSSSGVLSWTNKAGLDNPASVNIKGAKGDKGDAGAQGIQGAKGDKGDKGEQGLQGIAGTAATIRIGSVYTGEPGTNASVTNSGTASNVVLDFTLPRGNNGADGGIVVDTAMSDTSTNPVQNKVIKVALDNKVNKTDKIYEANLEWGGRNITDGYGPIDAAMISELGANRFAFGNVEGITVEYSEDAGETWVEYPLTDTAKVRLFSIGGNYLYAGGEKSRTPSVNDMIRVTIDSDAFGTYTALNKFAIAISTGGNRGCYCTIDASLESSPTAFKVFADKVPIEGWSGYNIINTQSFETYGNQPSRQYGTIRFTFGCTTVNTTYKGLAIVKIMGFGGAGWNTPSNMAQNGHLYQYNESQEAKFPASITAPNFIGKVNGKTIEASVPANAKFTDTVYTHPATHPASMIIGLSTVATSGSYNDLTDKPNIPASSTVDSELSSTSTNPVQNKVIYNALLNKVGTDIYSGFALMGATSTIAWRQGSQPMGSINATNYTGTAAKATQDGAGNVITETYATKADVSGVVKSVNDTKPDASGNVTIAVSGGGVSTSESNTWSAQQNFHDLMLNREKYTTYVINGTSEPYHYSCLHD